VCRSSPIFPHVGVPQVVDRSRRCGHDLRSVIGDLAGPDSAALGSSQRAPAARRGRATACRSAHQADSLPCATKLHRAATSTPGTSRRIQNRCRRHGHRPGQVALAEPRPGRSRLRWPRRRTDDEESPGRASFFMTQHMSDLSLTLHGVGLRIIVWECRDHLRLSGSSTDAGGDDVATRKRSAAGTALTGGGKPAFTTPQICVNLLQSGVTLKEHHGNVIARP